MRTRQAWLVTAGAAMTVPFGPRHSPASNATNGGLPAGAACFRQPDETTPATAIAAMVSALIVLRPRQDPVLDQILDVVGQRLPRRRHPIAARRVSAELFDEQTLVGRTWHDADLSARPAAAAGDEPAVGACAL